MKATPVYSTNLGAAYVGDARELLRELDDNSVDLIMTSPPFALQRQKAYGNLAEDEYVDWFLTFAQEAHRVVRPTGSFVVDFGGAYRSGKPVRSLYNYRVLLRMCDEQSWHLAEEFFWFNPAKLPSPIEWVNKRKIRAKDSVNTVWWFSKTVDPKADVRRVLTPYSERMKKLLKNPSAFYTPKARPSGHDIGSAFGDDNGGAIPSNLLQIPNTESNSQYLRYCKASGVSGHPARFPVKLPEFFVNFLTDPQDLVLDIFAGSNTTGAACEALDRRWMAFDLDQHYVAASAFRFVTIPDDSAASLYDSLAMHPPANFYISAEAGSQRVLVGEAH